MIDILQRLYQNCTPLPKYHHDATLDECADSFCPNCSRKLVKNGSFTLKHVAIGGVHTNSRVSYARFRCLNTDCQFNTRSQSISFKADGYRITKPLKEYTEKLLSYGLTLKTVAWLTGLDKMTVKSIHMSLLLSKFTTDGKTLIKPERQAKCLAIDELSSTTAISTPPQS